jgi:hypothetical protein
MSSRVDKRRKNVAEEDKDFDAAVEEASVAIEAPVNGAERLLFGLSALLVAAIPLFVYQKIYFVPLESNVILFSIVTLLTASLLYLSYDMRMTTKASKVTSQVRELGASNDSEVSKVVRLETTAFSLFTVNTLFLLAYMFIAFYALSRVGDAWNYALSVPLAATAVYAIAYDAKN